MDNHFKAEVIFEATIPNGNFRIGELVTVTRMPERGDRPMFVCSYKKLSSVVLHKYSIGYKDLRAADRDRANARDLFGSVAFQNIGDMG